MQSKIVLGIETSCDDTSIALIQGSPQESASLLAHHSFSQEEVLKKWGGVIPEIAARNHLDKILPLLDVCFEEAKIKIDDIDLIAVTTHPGLLGPLLTGLNAAKGLALLAKKPIYPVNHLYAHLEAIFLTESEVSYPYLGLLVSGGHSLFLLVRAPDDFEILGSTIDDAAGEAFDKGGKLMGLGYPAGKIIDDLAKEGDASTFEFPIGLRESTNAQLSFSGVKTALRHKIEKILATEPEFLSQKENLSNLCASYQKAIVDALELKLRYAKKIAQEKLGFAPNASLPIVLGGGVACNSALREKIKDRHHNVYIVAPKFCTDNGAMVANYGLRMFESAIAFPDCLYTDAKGRFIDKSQVQSLTKEKS